MRDRLAVAACLACLAAAAPGAQSDPIAGYVQAHQREMVSTLIEFAALPNVKGDATSLQCNAAFARDMLVRRGFSADVVATSGAPLVLRSGRALLRAVPDDEAGLLTLFGLSAPEDAAESLQEAYQRPSLTIRGLSSGHVGSAAAGMIPNVAMANLDLRLVTETRGAEMLRKVRAHLAAQGFHVVDADPDAATRARYRDIVKLAAGSVTEAYRIDVTTPRAKVVIDALTSAFMPPPVVLRTSGATLPMAGMAVATGAPAILVQTVNFDNNQHTDNENIRLGHLFAAVRTIAALVTSH